jgi:uncharacterized damage-inducible protein DinB
MNDDLLTLLDEAYERTSWHGPNLRQALRGVSPAKAARRPRPRRHSIWELALHAAYWKYVVRRRLTGAKRGSFDRTPSNFPAIRARTAAGWRADLEFLDGEHRSLRTVVATRHLTRAQQFLVRGVAFHDIYHAGQIRLLRRLV